MAGLIKVISYSCHSLMQVGESFALCSHSQTQTSSTLQFCLLLGPWSPLHSADIWGREQIMHGSFVWLGWKRSISHPVGQISVTRPHLKSPSWSPHQHQHYAPDMCVKKSPEDVSPQLSNYPRRSPDIEEQRYAAPAMPWRNPYNYINSNPWIIPLSCIIHGVSACLIQP